MKALLKPLILALLATGIPTAQASTVYLVDFNDANTNTASPDANGNYWNVMNNAGGSNIVSTTNDASSISISTNGFNNSTADTQWTGSTATRADEPSWIAADSLNALEYRIWLDSNSRATTTISGLDPNLTYDIEFASATRTNGMGRPTLYNIVGGNSSGGFDQNDDQTSMAPINGLTGDAFPWSTTVGDYGYSFYANVDETTNTDAPSDGWFVWSGIQPTAGGEIILQQSTVNNQGSGRGAMNAMQITAIPEPGTLALLGAALGFLYVLKRKH